MSLLLRLRPALPFLFPLLAAPLAAQEAAPASKPKPPEFTFLWKVEKEGLATSHLFGTIHVPDERVNTLHAEVRAALNGADAFFAELELDDTSDMQEALLAAAALPEGTTLKSLLPADVYRRAGEALGDFMLNGLNRFKPFMLEMTLAQQELMPDLMAGKEALDMRLYKVAKSKNMRVGGVETIEEQIEALANTLTVEEQVESLTETLDKYFEAKARGRSDLQRMLDAWLSGSEKWMLAIGEAEWDPAVERDRRVREALLFRRNANMAERAAHLMRENPGQKFVFAFGTYHFIGERSVVEMLRADGFQVTRLLAPPAELEERLIEKDEVLQEQRAAKEPVGAGGR